MNNVTPLIKMTTAN